MMFEFRTYHLHSLLEHIRKSHPYRKGELIQSTVSIIEKVRELLKACSKDKLSQLAYQFDLRQLLACIEIIANDKEGEIAQKAVIVSKMRPRPQSILRCWFRLVKSYPTPLLEELIRHLLQSKGFSILENNTKITNKVPIWFVSKSLSEGAFNDFQKNSAPLKLDEYLISNLLNAEDGLYQEIWRCLLLKGTAANLTNESASRVLHEFKKVTNNSYRSAFSQRYLNAICSRNNWANSILDYIYDNFGSPGDQTKAQQFETRFWAKVSEKAKREFHLWLILRQIETFFEGERANFWRQFVENGQVRDVQKILSGEGFMLEFGNFGVVEFKNVGNAAYVYPANSFKHFWDGAKSWPSTPAYFKEKTKTIKPYKFGWDGRICHHGGWQSIAKARLMDLLRTI